MARGLIVYLVDTNVWLERLLGQQRDKEVQRFLERVPPDQLLVTDFTLHSIAVVLARLQEFELLERFVRDLFSSSAVRLINLPPEAFPKIVDTMQKYRLDFDDAYQYVAARQYSAHLVSFDRDFDRTDLTRLEPHQLMEQSP